MKKKCINAPNFPSYYRLIGVAFCYVLGLLLIKGLYYFAGVPSSSALLGAFSLALCLLMHTTQIVFSEWPLFMSELYLIGNEYWNLQVAKDRSKSGNLQVFFLSQLGSPDEYWGAGISPYLNVNRG